MAKNNLQNSYQFKLFAKNELKAKTLFTTRFLHDTANLKSSINNLGILTPIVIISKENEWHIIDGEARFLIANELGISIPAQIIDTEFNLTQLFTYCLELNHLARSFNIIEIAHLLKQAGDFYPKDLPQHLVECLGLQKQPKALHQYLSLLKLPLKVQEYAVTHKTSLNAMLTLLKLPKAEIEPITEILFTMPLNQNKLTEIITNLWDISKRNQSTPLSVLKSSLSSIGEINDANSRERLLRDDLHQKRHPRLMAMKQDFKEKTKSLPKNNKIKIEPAPFFNEDYLEIQAKLSGQEDLNLLISFLQHKAWNELLEE